MKQLGWTSLGQSKKLVEAGLIPKTSDMTYRRYKVKAKYEWFPECVPYNHWLTKDEDGCSMDLDDVKPCWSLGALLELMPPYLFDFNRGIDLNIYRNMNGIGWHVSYLPNNIIDMKVDDFRQITNGHDAIDSAVEMIVWLLENGYIKK